MDDWRYHLPRYLLLAALGLALLGVLGGIAYAYVNRVDRGQCLTWHTEYIYQVTMVGKVPINRLTPVNECDTWQYPMGRS